ncbi:unnamed protein product [Aphanomyces euteiches]|uniref:FYVE-type domain-containing protein n=1 Tax=Aphanomyces euteiches TaxID=100861 RepID=A0A6G0X686_9STRA|nr:hypothetical protein Ae201684_008245 [Aphanomyces euteiches]KAH9070373.1 hypothetical protein Ae201684P_002732 [Aphanomyces euteiches]KAH9135293.1 hypothetical protein AeRB84_019224 [Aphanomyces euteiches]
MSAIELAERSAWAELQEFIKQQPTAAQECDEHGMLPLHWACTDASVTLEAVEALIQVFPAAVRTKNSAGMLPLHIAVKAEIDIPIVEAILNAYPEGLDERTAGGETAGDMARKMAAPLDLCDVLHIEYEFPRRLSAESVLSLSRSSSSSSWSVQVPPRWHHDKACHVCHAKFGPFRSRHHCRGCGISVCNMHSRGRMALPHLGLQTLQRVCASCFEEFNPDGPGISTNTLTSSRNQRRIRSQTEDFLKPTSSKNSRWVQQHRALARLRDLETPSDTTTRTSSESVHEMDLLQESIQTVNRTKALLQEQLAASQSPNTSSSLTPEAVLDVAQTQHLLGIALAEKGNHSSAILELRRSLALKTNPTAMYDLGKALHASGDLDGAEVVLREAIVVSPDEQKQKIYTLLGKVLHAKGDSDGALEVFQQAMGHLSHIDDESSEEDFGTATAEF